MGPIRCESPISSNEPSNAKFPIAMQGVYTNGLVLGKTYLPKQFGQTYCASLVPV